MNIFEELNNQIKKVLPEDVEADKETLRKGLLGFLNQFENNLSIADIKDTDDYAPHLTTFKIDKPVKPYENTDEFAITTSETVLKAAVQEYIENEEDEMGGYAVLKKYGYIDMGNAEYYIQPEWFEKYFENDSREIFDEYLNYEFDEIVKFCEEQGLDLAEFGVDTENKEVEKYEELREQFVENRMNHIGRGSDAVYEYIGNYDDTLLKEAFAKGAKIKADAIAEQYFTEDMMEKVFASVEEVADYYDGNNYYWILVL